MLPDGASALYGSDAIAGVVNVITRKHFEGAETHLRFSTPVGGLKEQLIAQLFGTDWETGNAVVAYQYSARSALPASARPFAANADKRPFGGDDFRSPSSSPGNIFDPRTLLPAYGIETEESGTPLTVADSRPDRINLQNPFASVELLPSKRMHSGYFSATQRLGDRFELFADGRFSVRKTTLSSFAAEQLLIVPSSNPFYVSPYPEVPFVIVGYSFENDLGPVVGQGQTWIGTGSLGLRADLSDSWRLTLLQSYGAQNTSYRGYNQPNMQELAHALADPNAETAFNPFGAGQNDEAILDAIRGVQTEGSGSTVWTLSLVADGTLFSVPTGDVKLALGTEVRHEQFANGITVNNSFGREVDSAFAELAVPIIGRQGTRDLPHLELSLAARQENFSDFGGTVNPKIGLRWTPAHSVRLRTTWGTSFSAPKLVDVYDTSQNLALLVSLPDPRQPSGASVVLARQGNNPGVSPETSSIWTAGVDIAPDAVPGLRASLTYYDLDYRNRIIVPGPASAFDALVTLDAWVGYQSAATGYFGDIEIGAGVVNVFNSSPPFVNREIGYDVVNADPYGRVVTATVRKTW